jgi:hypothetical protein
VALGILDDMTPISPSKRLKSNRLAKQLSRGWYLVQLSWVRRELVHTSDLVADDRMPDSLLEILYGTSELQIKDRKFL